MVLSAEQVAKYLKKIYLQKKHRLLDIWTNQTF